jgi:hypothetical protein
MEVVEMNHQKDIAELIKKINWLRQNPEVQPDQLEEIKLTLLKLVTALETK